MKLERFSFKVPGFYCSILHLRLILAVAYSNSSFFLILQNYASMDLSILLLIDSWLIYGLEAIMNKELNISVYAFVNKYTHLC